MDAYWRLNQFITELKHLGCSSIEVSIKTHFGFGNIGNGVIPYNSDSPNHYDKNPRMQKTILNIKQGAILGL